MLLEEIVMYVVVNISAKKTPEKLNHLIIILICSIHIIKEFYVFLTR